MGIANALAETSAEICVAALTFAGAGAIGIAPFLAPLGKLAAMGFQARQGERARCVNNATREALKALQASPELRDTNLDRARLLIGDARASVDLNPELLAKAKRTGADGFRGYLIQRLTERIVFEHDDHLERRAVQIAFAASIDCLFDDPVVWEKIERDTLLDMTRDMGLVVSKLDELLDVVKQEREAWRKAEGRVLDGQSLDTGLAQFSLLDPNTVILAWYEAPNDWWETTGNALRSALDRLSSKAELVPQPWNLLVLDYNPAALAEARGPLWQPLSNPASVHAATIVCLGSSLSQPLPVDTTFVRRLKKRDFLAEEIGDRGFMDAKPMSGPERRAMVDAGAIPITAETRLILETLLAERPLLIWDNGGEGPRDDEVVTLLGWLRNKKVTICDGRVAAGDSRWALNLVAEIFDIGVGQIPNPYRKLDHYLPTDADNYYGRAVEAGQARAWLENAKAGAGHPCLRIGGSSGVGKSSFLNARLAPLLHEAGLTYVTFRPTDFEIRPHTVFSPIREFCLLLESVVGTRLGFQDYPLINSQDLPRASAAAVKWITSLSRSGIRLLVGTDQFEEILDNIHNDWHRDAWSALLGLLAALPKATGSLLAVTLETSRETILADSFGETIFASAATIILRDNDEAFLRQVIVEPFAAVGMRLGEDVVSALIEETRRHQADIGKGSSSLPLLSLKLYGLFAHLAQQRTDPANSVSTSFVSAASEITLNDLAGYSVSIAEEIANLAEQAWSETGAGTLDDLDQFLRPYIRVVPVENDSKGRIVLQSVPTRPYVPMARRQSAFIRRRLIVPTTTGFRLVHESVIRRWSFASVWFDREVGSLLRQAALANEAVKWRARGRPPIANPSAEDIAAAARALRDAVAEWFDADDLTEATAIERDYCLTIFNCAKDPRIEVEASQYKNCYIHLAASYGLVDLLGRLLDADPEAVDLPRKDLRTPLGSASWVSGPAVALLLARGANPDIIDDGGFTALDTAVWGGNQDAFDLLLPLATSKSSPERCNPLYAAARQARHGMMEKLERHGFRHDAPSFGGFTALMGAAMETDLDMFEHCLSRGDPLIRNAEGLNTLDYAARCGNLEFLERLIRHPQGLDALLPSPVTGSTALMGASQFLFSKSVTYLLRLDVDPNAQLKTGEHKGRTALHMALDWLHRAGERPPRFVVEKTRATLEALLAAETLDVNVVAENGDTAYSMLIHHQGMRDLIVAHPSFRSSTLPPSVETPLDQAIEQGDREKIARLLDDPRHVSAIDRVNASGKTPAVAMLNNGLGDMVASLIRSNHINPWLQARGYSGLLRAALNADNAEVVELTLERMPASISASQLTMIVFCKSTDDSGMVLSTFDGDHVVFARALHRVSGPEDLGGALERAGTLGNADLFARLLLAGADGMAVDDWGRSVADRSADRVRLSPLVQSFMALRDRIDSWPWERRLGLVGGDLQLALKRLESDPTEGAAAKRPPSAGTDATAQGGEQP